MPKVSIIVPVYKVEKYLGRCINSLINQTLTDIEIILVDDKSPDNCPGMCDNYALKDNRIKVVHKDRNEGLGFARNTGMKIATGEYIAFVDSDDYIETDTYKKAFEECTLNNLDICYFRYKRFDDQGNEYTEFNDTVAYDFYNSNDSMNVLLAMMGDNSVLQIKIPVMVWCGLYKRSVIEEHNIVFKSERELVSEDLVFNLDLLPKTSRIRIIPNVFYNYFVNQSSLSSTYNDTKIQKIVQLLGYLKEKLSVIYSDDTYKNGYTNYILRMFKVIIRYISWENTSIRIRRRRIKDICKMNILNDLYVNRFHNIKDAFFVFCMKHKIALFFIFLYKKMYHKYGFNC